MEMIQKKFYSSGRTLILEFHTDAYDNQNQGFQGRFKFLSAGKSDCTVVLEALGFCGWFIT
jgi:hypothetical protein